MISYRDALANALVPALVVGPTLGAAGACGLMFIGAAMGNAGDLAIAVFASVVGAVLGLVAAGPICLLAGAWMLWLASRNPAWLGWWRVSAVAALVGLIAGATFALIQRSDVQSFLAITGLTTALGALGGPLFRRLVRVPLAEMRLGDSEVFD